MTRDEKRLKLGRDGERIIGAYMMNNGRACGPVFNDYHMTADLWEFPNWPNTDIKFPVQVKTQVPYFKYKSASFDPDQWERYKNNPLFIVCAPTVEDKFKDDDIWKGNVYEVPRPFPIDKIGYHTNENTRQTVLLRFTDLIYLGNIGPQGIAQLAACVTKET